MKTLKQLIVEASKQQPRPPRPRLAELIVAASRTAARRD